MSSWLWEELSSVVPGNTLFSSYCFSFSFSSKICRNGTRHWNVILKYFLMCFFFVLKLSMVVLGVSRYLLSLLLTYHCILANVTVQADNITLQLIGKRREEKEHDLSTITALASKVTIIKKYGKKQNKQTIVNTNRWLYLLGPVGIFQRVVGVIKWLGWGANVGNHNCPAVATQGVLQYPCQLAVPVRYVSLLTLKQRRSLWVFGFI